jgi:hypothetical protein
MSFSAEPIPFARLTLREHRHVCAFFNSAQDEYDTLLPFICDGLNCGRRAFHVLPSQHRANHLQRLRDVGVEVERAQESRQLEVALPEETYLRGGRFDKDAMLTLIQETLRQAENWASLLRAWLSTPRPPSTTGPAPTNGLNTRCVLTCCRTTMIRSFAPTMSTCSMPILPLISCAHILL